MISPKGSFKGTAIKQLKGLLIAVIGCAAVYITQVPESVDFGAYAPVAVVVFSAIANALRQWKREIN